MREWWWPSGRVNAEDQSRQCSSLRETHTDHGLPKGGDLWRAAVDVRRAVGPAPSTPACWICTLKCSEVVWLRTSAKCLDQRLIFPSSSF
jgi:hypothetical protein